MCCRHGDNAVLFSNGDWTRDMRRCREAARRFLVFRFVDACPRVVDGFLICRRERLPQVVQRLFQLADM